jgi:hypothetical protein
MGASAIADAGNFFGGEKGFIVLEPGEDESDGLLDGDGVTGAFERGFLDEVAGALFAEVREGLGKDSDFRPDLPVGHHGTDVESPESAAVDELEEVIFVEVEQVFGGLDGEQREARRGDAEGERELARGDHLRRCGELLSLADDVGRISARDAASHIVASAARHQSGMRTSSAAVGRAEREGGGVVRRLGKAVLE